MKLALTSHMYITPASSDGVRIHCLLCLGFLPLFLAALRLCIMSIDFDSAALQTQHDEEEYDQEDYAREQEV